MCDRSPSPGRPRGRLEVVAAVVWVDPGRLVVQRRPPTAAFGPGAYEFVGGKVEAGEPLRAALRRELAEEWGGAARAIVLGPPLAPTTFEYEDGPRVRLHLFHARVAGLDDPSSIVHLADGALAGHLACVRRSALAPERFLAADRRVVAALRDGTIRWPFGRVAPPA